MQGHAFLVEQDFAGTRRADLVVFDFEHIGAAELMNANNFGHHWILLKNGNFIGRLRQILMTRRARFHLGGLGARVRTAHLFALTVLPDRPQPVDRPVTLRPTLYHHFDHGLLMDSRAAGVKLDGGWWETV